MNLFKACISKLEQKDQSIESQHSVGASPDGGRTDCQCFIPDSEFQLAIVIDIVRKEVVFLITASKLRQISSRSDDAADRLLSKQPTVAAHILTSVIRATEVVLRLVPAAFPKRTSGWNYGQVLRS